MTWPSVPAKPAATPPVTPPRPSCVHCGKTISCAGAGYVWLAAGSDLCPVGDLHAPLILAPTGTVKENA